MKSVQTLIDKNASVEELEKATKAMEESVGKIFADSYASRASANEGAKK